MKKNLLLTLLSLTLSITAWGNGTRIDGINFILDNSTNTACVTYTGSSYNYGNSYSGSVTIPSSITYSGVSYSVISIGKYAFSDCTRLKSITIPNSVTTIESSAFRRCTGLTNITIPNSVTNIHSYAFQECTGLTNITIPNSVKSIYYGVFSGCNLERIVVEQDNEKYDSRNNCNAIIEKESNTLISGCKSTIIPNSVTSIGYCAFQGCSGLTSITIPNSVTSIDEYNPFETCSNLERIVVEQDNEKYDSRNNCNAIIEKESNTLVVGCKSTIVPNSVTSIGKYAFYGCSGLTSVTIGNGVTNIGSYAFYGCSGLTSVTISNSVTSIDYDAFQECTGLNRVNILDIESWCNISFADNDSNPLYYAHHLFLDSKEIIELDIPESVTTIKAYAFIRLQNLKSVSIPNSVTWIGYNAFEDCSSLTSLTIPNSLTFIHEYVFRGCTSLSSVTIPNNVTSIGSYAFYGCTGLTRVTIPKSVKSINKKAFQGCTGLADVICLAPNVPTTGEDVFTDDFNATLWVPLASMQQYQSKDPWRKFKRMRYMLTIDNLDYLVDDENNTASVYGLSETGLNANAIAIPATITYNKTFSVTNIMEKVFQNCENLVSVIIGDNVTDIGSCAFQGCINLNSISIGKGLTSISNTVFNGCTSLNSVTLKSDAIVSKDYTTNACLKNLFGEHVKDYTLGEEVNSIGDYAFKGCNSLTKLSISGSMKSIGKNAFSDCHSLQKVVVSDISAWSHISLENIESNPLYYAHRVYTDENTEITELVIPEDVEIIREYVFAGCNRLSSVIIPSSVRKMAKNAFEGCNSFNTVTLKSDSVISKEYTSSFGFKDVFGKQVKKYVLGEQVTSIGNYAFYNCTELVSINIPNHVTHIGTAAFNGCIGLTSANIPNSVTSIGDNAFAGCSSLTAISIPNSVIDMPSDAFAKCSALTSITMESNALVSKNYTSSLNLTTIFGNQVKEYILGKQVKSIGNYTFYRCTGLTSIPIPENLTSIGNNAFDGCSNLTSINLPSNLKTIGTDAFKGCDKLSKVTISDLATWCSITFDGYNGNSNPLSLAHHLYNADGTEITDLVIPEGVESINNYAFYGGSNFTSVTIPSSLKKIGNSAFYGCNNLSKVVISDLAAWCSTSFDNNPLWYAHRLYNINGTEIQDLTIPTGVGMISDGAFSGCSSLKSLVIPNDVEYIGIGAFASCSDLATVVIPNSVKAIGSQAFADCMNLYSVTSLINIPFKLNETVFEYTGYEYDKDIMYNIAKLYVPTGRSAVYGVTTGWKKFMNIVEIDTKFKLTYIVDGTEYKSYEIQATEVVTPEPDPFKEGYIFSGWSTIPSIMPAHDVIVYGTFTVDPEYAGVETIESNGETPKSYYTIDGNRHESQQKGLNIIRMSDGTIKKVMMK